MIKYLLDLLYPPKPKCSICGRAGRLAVCNACMASLDYLQGITCLHCGKQLNEQYDDCTCPDCKTGIFYYERAYSCFEYGGMGKKLIHKLKYEGMVQLANVIAGLMAERLENERLVIDAIVPVPIHKKKLEARGFNQSQIIARELGERLHKPVMGCLERMVETKEQYNLDRNQRFLNIRGAFSVKLSYNIGKYKNILLVDDIYTTGSTVNECSKLLKDAGAAKVYVITAATGSNT
ncbi:MAG TPA: ComF family protein [Bacillota bacterium]|nr:ComF family protein [Clostridiaceae bacterium]HNR03628.1 ComF family protein [Bacillota bacterium]HNT02616.1 ComF family protein [Bacillota bacterium]HOH89042.1 ComF family protein [Bacillota bacterium]HPA54835.1 ComF family protein [Bacillota bacterium]